MIDFHIPAVTQREKALSSKNVQAFSWASVSQSAHGPQTVNLHLFDAPKIIHQRSTNIRTVHGNRLLQRDNKKIGEKDTSKLLSRPVSSYRKNAETVKTHGNSTTHSMKVIDSLPNLLMIPAKNENNISSPESPDGKLFGYKQRRIADKIALNFKFKPGHSTQSPGGVKAFHKRSTTAINPTTLSARLEHLARSGDISRKMTDQALTTDRKSNSPLHHSIRIVDSNSRQLHTERVHGPSAFDMLEEDLREDQGQSRRSTTTNFVIKRNEAQYSARDTARNINTVTTFRDVSGEPKKKSQRPMSTGKIKTGLFDIKVTEEQRERLAMFLKDDFVNDLIFTKYYQVMDDDEKLTALKSLKNKMAENKIIREKFNEKMKDSDANFFEQFNKTRNEMWKKNLKQSKSIKDVLSLPQSHRVEAFGLFTPVDSPTADIRNKILGELGEENDYPKSEKIKDFDYYVNLELAKSANLEEAKKKKKTSTNKFWQEAEEGKFARIRKSLLEKLLKCMELKFTREEIMNRDQLFPTKPFEKHGSYAFLKAAKYGDAFRVLQYLDQDRFYVFEYDSIKQTGLHWAAKRNQFDVCKMLTEHGADPDSVDLGGRTPLYYALREGNPEIVRLLLSAKASPWSIRGHNYKDCCKNELCLKFLSRARQLHLLMAFYPIRERREIWERESKVFLANLEPQ